MNLSLNRISDNSNNECVLYWQQGQRSDRVWKSTVKVKRNQNMLCQHLLYCIYCSCYLLKRLRPFLDDVHRFFRTSAASGRSLTIILAKIKKKQNML